jgi:hypothetical protein
VSAVLPRILRTSSFRLTLLYAGLFGCSALILLGVIYEATGVYMATSLDAAIDSDVAELQENLRAGGNEALTAQVMERVRQTPNGPMYYLLQDSQGRVRPEIFRPRMAEKEVSISKCQDRIHPALRYTPTVLLYQTASI